jgi:hypothetical protein
MKEYSQNTDKIRQLVEKFTNGRERYQVDALLNNIINSLARGADAYEIIDQLIIMNNELVKKNIELTSKSPVTYVINKEMLK